MPADEPHPQPQPAPHQSGPPQAPPLDVNLDLAGLDAPPGISDDRQARKEEKQLFGDWRRREELRETVHAALVLSLRVALLFFLAVFAVRVLHFILPENNAVNAGTWLPHGWLTEVQLGAIDKFATGALGIIVAQFARRFIAEDPERKQTRSN
jgi:hypothetical protein